ncbi:MAG: hypothetical protein M0Z43_02935 [Acidithiobacillus sp.]|nr:hypothetical protein [Acidithiobacillus sp.]
MDEADLVTQKEAAQMAGRSVQDVSTALRVGRIMGYTLLGRDIRQPIWIMRSDVPQLRKRAHRARARVK